MDGVKGRESAREGCRGVAKLGGRLPQFDQQLWYIYVYRGMDGCGVEGECCSRERERETESGGWTHKMAVRTSS